MPGSTELTYTNAPLAPGPAEPQSLPRTAIRLAAAIASAPDWQPRDTSEVPRQRRGERPCPIDRDRLSVLAPPRFPFRQRAGTNSWRRVRRCAEALLRRCATPLPRRPVIANLN